MVRPIVFYLPQFHPIPENDTWWGPGFTEWTNAAKAKPLFEGHYQPHVPADLGFYDLRVPETRAAQADLARRYGIEGFCYYHYWFGDGRQLLERPFNQVLASGEPDFPFCLCWANQSWTGIWHGAPNRMLMEQTYPGEADDTAHFEYLLKAFRDPRYITVEGRPLMLIFAPRSLPDPLAHCRRWRQMAEEAGLPGLHLLAVRIVADDWDAAAAGFDGSVEVRTPLVFSRNPAFSGVRIIDHRKMIDQEFRASSVEHKQYPCVGHTWDNTPRSGLNGVVYVNSTPAMFKSTVSRASAQLTDRPPEDQLLFIKSWNEWAEGNHLEPDLRYGHAWLEALRDGLPETP